MHAVAVIMMVLVVCDECAGSDCAKLGVVHALVLLVLPLPEGLLFAGTRRVVVLGARSITLFALLGTAQQYVKDCRHEEE